MKKILVNPRAISDLHVHTKESDGIYTFQQILEAVRQRSKKFPFTLAFTDHHTTNAYDQCIATEDLHGIDLIPAVEISTSDYKSMHIIGYGIYNKVKRRELNAHLSSISKKNTAQLFRIIIRLKEELDIPLGNDFMERLEKTGSISRKQIAEELARIGKARSARQAYKELVGPAGLVSEETFKPTIKEAIELIKKMGGVACWAHPHAVVNRTTKKHLTSEESEELLHEMKGYGLKAIECIPPAHCKNKREFWKSQSNNFKLISLGGTDFHGNRYDIKNEELGNPNLRQRSIDQLKGAITKSNKTIWLPR